MCNTPGTRGGSKLRDRTLAVPKKRAKISFFRKKIKIIINFFDIPFSYAKLLGETNFQPREFPRSGSKAKDGKEKKKNTPGTAGGPGGFACATFRSFFSSSFFFLFLFSFPSFAFDHLRGISLQAENLFPPIVWHI